MQRLQFKSVDHVAFANDYLVFGESLWLGRHRRDRLVLCSLRSGRVDPLGRGDKSASQPDRCVALARGQSNADTVRKARKAPRQLGRSEWLFQDAR